MIVHSIPWDLSQHTKLFIMTFIRLVWAGLLAVSGLYLHGY